MALIALLIPAYNAEPTIGRLLGRCLGIFKADDVLVVDDGSKDATRRIVEACGVGVFAHQSNRGKGAALRSGFKRLRELGYDWCITMDADLQHDPDLLADFIAAIERDERDLIIGSREFTRDKMPGDRIFSNNITSWMLGIATGVRIRDAQCGYRGIRLSIIDSLELYGDRFDLESELILKASRKGARIGWINIPTVYAGEGSHIARVADTLRFIKMYLRFCLVGR